MIQTKEKFQIVADDSIDSAKFSLNAENLPHIFGILRDNLYSDKILAFIREYSTNATDANQEAGRGNKPIHVTLPTTIDPVFKVRDFGYGLSKDNIFNVFSSYGASTKRETNELIGTLGMGSKSGFAYQSSFTVTSYHEGKKSIYEAYIDETDLGTISLLHEEVSTEPSGLEITIAVHKDDIFVVKDKAITFYSWFEPTPVFYGVDITTSVNKNKFYDYNILYQSDSCVIYKYKNNYNNKDVKILVHMGNICYPVTNFDNIDVSWFHGCSIVIRVKIGEVTFTTSRESLEMKKNTLDTINRYLEEIKKTFAEKIQLDIDACPTPWAAICLYNKLDDIQKNLLPTIVFNGKTLSLEKIKGLEYTHYHQSKQQWVKCNERPWNYNHSGIILNDGGFPTNQTSIRLKEAKATLEKTGALNVFYIKTNTVDATKEIIDFLEFEGLDFVLLSAVAAKVVKNYKKNAFSDEKYFKWNKSNIFPYSNCWSAFVPDQKKVCVYVEIEKFTPVSNILYGDPKQRWSFLYKISSMIQQHKNIDFELYGIRKSQLKNLPSNWISLEDYLSGIVKEIINDQSYLDLKIKSSIYGTAKNNNSFMNSVINKRYDFFKNNIECPIFKEIIELSGNFTQVNSIPQDNIIKTISMRINISNELKIFNDKVIKATQQTIDNLNTKIKYCLKKYPLIDVFHDNYCSYGGFNDTTAKHLVNYANLIYRAENQQQMTI